MIEAIKCVDEVVVYHQVDNDVKKHDFDVFVVGGDQKHDGFIRAIEWCHQNNKEVIILDKDTQYLFFANKER